MEHLSMSVAAWAVALCLALPLGLFLGHTGRGGGVAINVANIARAIPSLAVLSLSLPLAFGLGLGLGFWPTVIALVPLGIPPILINTYTAIRSVDKDIVEAARGMGMDGWQVLRQAEVPTGAPVILTGLRTAAVTIVATATLGAIVASGGLGRYLVDGLARQDETRLFVGALLVAILAMLTEGAFAWLGKAVVSPGLQQAGRHDQEPWMMWTG
ncbi:MAG: ABC transporter permease [Chloroflexi bacterium]|nr:ABC transporter permease [Chloroflexota bacterium]